MSQSNKKLGWVKRFVRWLFSVPFEDLPPEMGDPVPPELRAFEEQAEEAQHHPIASAASESARGKPNEPHH